MGALGHAPDPTFVSLQDNRISVLKYLLKVSG
jgi:hypothetical protein